MLTRRAPVTAQMMVCCHQWLSRLSALGAPAQSLPAELAAGLGDVPLLQLGCCGWRQSRASRASPLIASTSDVQHRQHSASQLAAVQTRFLGMMAQADTSLQWGSGVVDVKIKEQPLWRCPLFSTWSYWTKPQLLYSFANTVTFFRIREFSWWEIPWFQLGGSLPLCSEQQNCLSSARRSRSPASCGSCSITNGSQFSQQLSVWRGFEQLL